MILTLQRTVRQSVTDAARRLFPDLDVPPFSIEVPPNRTLGDLAVTLAFQLARPLRRAPRAIAQDLAAALGPIPGVDRIVVAPNGFLNLFLDRRAFLLASVRADKAPPPGDTGKTIVEHTAINPNKAAHIGHLRNATLGDTLARVLRDRGTPVEVQNYIDDTGVQVADVIVGFTTLEHRNVDEVRGLADTTRFDYYCWDLYSRVTEWYEADRSRLAVRAATLHELEHGGTGVSEMAALIVDRIVRAHLATMARLNIGYDLLTYEGDILRLQFWAQAFDILKAHGAVYRRAEGRLAGCWVMRIEDGASDAEAPTTPTGEATDGRGPIEAEGGPEVLEPDAAIEPGDDEAKEKVIVRSNGVVTYVGKDIANQFWKFGLLGRDFRYRPFGRQVNGQMLWATTSSETTPDAPAFGRAFRIYNVIDSRQMYLQALLSQALRTLGYTGESERSIHFSYEMVALSHQTARELGYAPESAEKSKPFVEVSGRKGLGVKIDDLLDLLIEKASSEIERRNPDAPLADRRHAASQIAVAAIRYFMLKFSRSTLIVFDVEEALSFEGETGPYLQYAVVRATNILAKLREREQLNEADVLARLDEQPTEELAGSEPHDLWAIVLDAARLDDVVDQVIRTLEFSSLAKYAFGLAQRFNAFYHQYPIVNEDRADRKLWRAAGVGYVRGQLARACDLMGIAVPARM
jgi:arginyl-tRNA synthetase